MTKNKEKNLKEELNDSSVSAETAQESVQEAQPENVDNASDKEQLSEEEKLRLQVEELEGKLAGKEFDTDLHEAVAQFPVQEEEKKGKVFDVVQTGYTLNGKVIRFAKVVVGI